uniref:Spermatogenesis-associated protein 20-like TRX domain-containing protein n=2 Tax=Clastoptera arizonana TaxID=38151 RepID=A0A1B6DA39_9HEMI
MFPGRFSQCPISFNSIRSLKLFNKKRLNTILPNRVDVFNSCSNWNISRRFLFTYKENILYIMASSSTSSKHLNRLNDEKSPYLLQHASNPVDWYPWGEEAFEKAQKEDKLIFLSVGYSTCHWCHVMERESFEDEEIAEIMNKYFVNIKVDREERPDVDKVYMTFVQASSGSGGWPMSVFLTPDLKPVGGGTYFPPKDNWGRPGFKSILLSIAKQWKEDKRKLANTGSRIINLLKKTTIFDVSIAGGLISGLIPEVECAIMCGSQLVSRYDPVYGGFGLAPKFPQPVNFMFGFHAYARDPNNKLYVDLKDMCLHTLTMMAKGGIHDHISQGFARYSTDERWHVPHFEKMLYDQGQLAVVYSYAYIISKNQMYADTVKDILTYVSRDLSHPEGGFYSAEDADSLPTSDSTEKREGAFCVWTYDEVKELLARPITAKPELTLGEVFSYHYGIEPDGNVDPQQDPHNELKGKNVLIMNGSEEKTAAKFQLDEKNLKSELEAGKRILFLERLKRPKPHLDDKIITSWNGLMISGYARAAEALNDDSYIHRAVQAAKFIKKHLYNKETKTLLRSCYTGPKGSVVQISTPINGFIDDYAFLIRGLLDLYECCFDTAWLEWANILQDKQDELFWDSESSGYFTTPSSDNLLLRLKEDQDGAEPSGNSVSAQNLLRLAAMLDRVELKEKAGSILASFTSRLTRIPMALPEMVSALMLFHDSPTQIVITGQISDTDTAAMLSVVRSRYIPGRVLLLADNNTESILYRNSDAVRKMKVSNDGRQNAYVCRHNSCSLPVRNPNDLAARLDQPD